jgi:hypothetical protein
MATLATLRARRGPVLPGEVRIIQEDLFSCRIAITKDRGFAILVMQKTRYNPVRYSVHPLMADGITIGALGRLSEPFADLTYDDITYFRAG